MSDLPTGWKSTSVDSSSQPDSPCGISNSLKVKVSGQAEADFADGDLPVFDEAIGGYSGSPTELFTKIISQLDQCTSFKLSGTTLTLGRMSFPTIGSDSAAFQASGTVQGVDVGFDFVFARKGNQVLLMVYGDIGTPDVTQLQSFAQQAAAKIPSGKVK